MLKQDVNEAIVEGLNPCCSGRWSRTNGLNEETMTDIIVLILVVVDDGLVL